MAQRSRFWDGTTLGDATVAPYDAGTEFSEVMTAVAGLSVNPNKGGPVTAVSITTPSANTVRLAPFEAIVYGAWYQSDANVDFVVATPAAATRIDVLVLRKSWAAQTVRALVITGAEGGAQPALVQTPGVTWDVPIATISINTAGAITLARLYERADLWYRTSKDNITTDNNIGIFTVPQPGPVNHPMITIGDAGTIVGSGVGGNPNFFFTNNTKWVGGNEQAIVPTYPAARIQLYNGDFLFYSAAGAAAGATQDFRSRFNVNANGSAAFDQPNQANSVQIIGRKDATVGSPQIAGMTLKGNGTIECYMNVMDTGFPNNVGIYAHAGGSRLRGIAEYVWNGGTDYVELGRDWGWGAINVRSNAGLWAGGYCHIGAHGGVAGVAGQNGGFLFLGLGTNGSVLTGNCVSVSPYTHNTTHLGWGDRGWYQVHAVAGLVQDCLADHKQDFEPLDPALCAEAVLDTDWLSFSYKPPERPALDRDENMTDDEWARFTAQYENVQQVETEYRKQRGYALGSPDFRVHSLFGTADRAHGGAQSDLATVACALQNALKRIAILEGRAN